MKKGIGWRSVVSIRKKTLVNCYQISDSSNGDSKTGTRPSIQDRIRLGGKKNPLRRLKTDVIDLFISIELILPFQWKMSLDSERLIHEGKLQVIWASEAGAAKASKSQHAVQPVTAFAKRNSLLWERA